MADLATYGLTPEDVAAMSDAELVVLIRRDWTSPWFGAVPWLDALSDLTYSNPESGIRDAYGAESPGTVPAYFIGNAAQWKGETARVAKKELKTRY